MSLENITYPGLIVVLIDDEKTCLNILTDMVRSIHFFSPNNIRAFTDPIEAWQYIKTEGADLVITDYCMPKINGDVLARQIRELIPKVKILLFTSSNLKGFEKIHHEASPFVDVIAEKVSERNVLSPLIQNLCEAITK